MRIEGEQLIPAVPDSVWALIQDPEVLRSCTPGVKTLERSGSDRYEATVEIAVAGIKGRYAGELLLRDLVEPRSLSLEVHGRGDMGVVDGRIAVSLEAVGDTSTRLVYAGDVEIGGRIARAGQRVLGGVAKMLIGQFFKCLGQRAAG